LILNDDESGVGIARTVPRCLVMAVHHQHHHHPSSESRRRRYAYFFTFITFCSVRASSRLYPKSDNFIHFQIDEISPQNVPVVVCSSSSSARVARRERVHHGGIVDDGLFAVVV
tara:strand:- start:171 stop:512 length:342 start_codon:yes stop_codon:yes gene_type:complete